MFASYLFFLFILNKVVVVELLELPFVNWFSAVLAHCLLDEKLQKMGMLGCLLCIVGSTIIVLHAPGERPIDSVDEIWALAIQPGLLVYFILRLYVH